MGLREWWDRLMGKDREDGGERTYRAASEGPGSATATESTDAADTIGATDEDGKDSEDDSPQ